MAAFGVFAQSSDQNYPTPVTTSEIRGAVRARDIGDSRLTTYFYAFDGDQGDVFVNVLTKNFNGDVDIFTVDGLKPLTKIVLYADAGVTETGRIVYLRRSERMLLRVEGRSPDDNPATFVIKFAGSFVALKPSRKPGDLGPPQVAIDESDGVRLSSAGAIVPVVQKPKAETAAKTDSQPPVSKAVETKKDTSAAVEKTKTLTIEKLPPSLKTTAKETKPAKTEISKVETKPVRSKPKDEKPPVAEPDPLENIHLVIEMKDGKVFERAMSEVLRFSADREVLTVIGKDGKVIRYAITDVSKVTIQ
jgi:hypothetical protein